MVMTVYRTLCQFAMKFGINIHEAWRLILNGVGDPLTFSSSANIRSDLDPLVKSNEPRKLFMECRER